MLKRIKQTKHTKKNSVARLIPLYDINEKQLKELAVITNEKETMKSIGQGNTWSIQDIRGYIKDEMKENAKPEKLKQYYTFVMVVNGTVIGFISGRKRAYLLGSGFGPFDLLMRMFIGKQYTGKGYGKIILKLFITHYRKIMKPYPKPIYLYSDIDKDNIASIKIHLANKFTYTRDVIYPYNKHLDRYTLQI